MTTKARDKQVGGSHYRDLPIQPTEYIRKNSLGWCEGNVIKYITRWQTKGGKQDLEKCIHYIELLLEDTLEPEPEELSPEPEELTFQTRRDK